MKILLTADPILPVPPRGYGGIERIIDGLIRVYRSRGYTVGLMAKTGSECATDRTFRWADENLSSKIGVFRNALALRRTVAEFAPDVVHSFSRLAYLTFVLPSRRPKIMSYQRQVGARQIRQARRLAGNSLRFTGCSDFICRQGRAGGGSWRAIPNFVEIEKYDFVPQVPIDSPLVFLSRIEAIKGAHLAIEIARRAGRRLVLAGNRISEGSGAEYFDRQIAPQLGRSGIEWIGEADDAKKNSLLGSAAALLVPVQWDEPFGIVFAEAMATGAPIITCARGALPEIVEPGRTGYFIETIEDGVRAIERLPLIDRSVCRAVAETQFSATVCADQYLALYEETLRKR